MDDGTTRKRVRLNTDAHSQAAEIRTRRAGFLSSLSKAVSPPPSTSQAEHVATATTQKHSVIPPQHSLPSESCEAADSRNIENSAKDPELALNTVPSPFNLTRIRDLPQSDNVDSISLHEILGDPLIREAWVFNYCFDVPFLMSHFDPDVRELVKVKLVHGSWRNEDSNKIHIDEACAKLPNVDAITAYLPDAFGTHHSKMFVLFKHDEQAQVIIHTANILMLDWSNMTQAVWKSPLLPISTNVQGDNDSEQKIGSGPRFKHDLLRYIRAYGRKLKELATELSKYDFSAVRGALVASVPSKFAPTDGIEKTWGHVALRNALTTARDQQQVIESSSHLVCQVSSIATLPQEWLESTLLSASRAFHPPAADVSMSIIFPTRADVGNSITGYADGGSIHVKAQSAAHLKQISKLRPHLSRWTQGEMEVTRAGRHLAAPHIKTFINFRQRPTKQNPTPDINWALVTSANLSQQAWGTVPKLPKGSKDMSDATVHVQSFEIGVLVWPALFAEHGDSEKGESKSGQIRIAPVFGKDTPNKTTAKDGETVVGLRMPYDLPLTPYAADELPWSPHTRYTEPDRYGRKWPDSFR